MALTNTKTAAEIQKELAEADSQRRALRRALREAQAAELEAAKVGLGEAVAELVSANSAEAIHSLTERVRYSTELAQFLHALLSGYVPQHALGEGDAEASPDSDHMGYDQTERAQVWE